jgi:hypothetical protein
LNSFGHKKDMKDVFQLEWNTVIPREKSYIISYPYILDYFQNINEFTARDFVCGAHMVYGWMPTILDLYPGKPNISLEQGAELLTRTKRNRSLSGGDIENLASLVNNSLVGASKLLHFTSPNSYPIWDSNIYSFIFGDKPHNNRVRKVSNYLEYMSHLQKIKNQPDFPMFHKSINAKLGYEVTPLRAIEIIMVLTSSRQ